MSTEPPSHPTPGEKARKAAEEKIVGMTPGWVPTYNDPDNRSGAPEAEPIYASGHPAPSSGETLETDAEVTRLYGGKFNMLEIAQGLEEKAKSLELRLNESQRLLGEVKTEEGSLPHWKLEAACESARLKNKVMEQALVQAAASLEEGKRERDALKAELRIWTNANRAKTHKTGHPVI